MEKPNLIEFDTIKKLLMNNHYYGFTAHRNNERISYKFKSVRFYAVTINVTTMKFIFEDGTTERYVLFIDVNDKRANDMEEFYSLFNNSNLNKLQNKEKLKFIKEK